MNLVASEKETWRRHRRIMGPAFNNRTFRLVWDETVKLYDDMIKTEGWDKVDSFEIDRFQSRSFKVRYS